MTRDDDILNEYFEWLYDLVDFPGLEYYRNLLGMLHDTEFTYVIANDKNRAADGINLRYRFAHETGFYLHSSANYTDAPCSVLEMMVALAVRCETHIMDDPDAGNRTGQWFWDMVVSLELKGMTNEKLRSAGAAVKTKQIIQRFLNRDYEPNGKGGLFTVRNCPYDLRETEIWYQMCWYLDDILRK